MYEIINKILYISDLKLLPPIKKELDTESIWETIKDIISPKSTFDEETHFNNLVSSEEPPSYDHEDTAGVWNTIRNIISPQAAQELKSHLNIPVSSESEYVQHHKKNSFWKKIKDVVSSNLQQDHEIEYDGPIATNSEYLGQEDGLFSKIKELIPVQNIRDIISPLSTADPEEHLNNLFSYPIVENIVNRVSTISRADMMASTGTWLKLVYQLLFIVITIIIGGAFLDDLNNEGGLV